MSALKRAVFLSLLTAAICAPLPCRGQDDSERIWGAAVMPQPFDAQPFRPVRIPAWVQETLGCGYTLSVMDGQQRAKAAAHGVTISEMGFVDPFYAY
ncbi:MAG TPA: hypothetical protein VN699_16055 [Pirellulales bacterium]|nr:hypothetical protein [Pirellulales bacterium]